MSQTTKIAFALFIGYIVFVTMKGQLPAYMAVVGLGKSSSQTAS